MKDRILLLVAGVFFAALSWAMWHYLGEAMPWVLLLTAYIATAADNVRLRRRLREKEKRQE